MKTIIVPAEKTQLDRVQDFIASEIEGNGCSPRTEFQIQVSVEELFVNIASYAYQTPGGKAEISVEITGTPPTLTIVFKDEGVPFDPLLKKDADVTPEGLMGRIGGLGILMAKKCMDEMFYEYKGRKNVLTVKKILG